MRPCFLVIALLMSGVATASPRPAPPASDRPLSIRPTARPRTLSPSAAGAAALREDLLQVRDRLQMERRIIMPYLWGGLFTAGGVGTILVGVLSAPHPGAFILYVMGSVFLAMGVTAFVSLVSIEGEYTDRIRATDRQLKLLSELPDAGVLVLRF